MINSIVKEFFEFGVSIDEKVAKKLLTFYEELIVTNETLNLTAITDFKEVVIKHFLDSASIINSDIELKEKSIIDVGTGAGFPGLILAILCPQTDVTLLETLNKRCRFLENVSSKLELNNVHIQNGRAEDFGKKSEYREKFDYSTSRAVASLEVLSEYLLPFIKLGGTMIAYKGRNAENEVDISKNAVSILGGIYRDSFFYDLPDKSGERALIFFDKVDITPDRFPRKAGIPTKRPL